MPEPSNTQRGVPAPPAITRTAKPVTGASMAAAIAPPFLAGGTLPVAHASLQPPAPVARGYQLAHEEADRIAQRLEQLAQQVRSRQLPGLDGAQGPEDIAGILIAAITDHVSRGH